MGKRKYTIHRPRLTPRQVEVLTLIRDHQKANGYSPTMQELADKMGVSKVTVFEHVESLIAKKLLRRAPHKARSLELTPRVELPTDHHTSLPVAGYISAGVPIEAVEDSDTLDLQALTTSRHEMFVLKVRGDSMIDEQIRDGDYVICERRHEQPNSGETVVALLPDGEATLKKFYKEKYRVRLEPANPNYAPIYPTSVEIQGVVRGVVRMH